MIKKTSLFLLFFFFYFEGIAQDTSIDYTITANDEFVNSTPDIAFMKNVLSQLNNISCTLTFNEEEMKFIVNPNSKVSSEDYDMIMDMLDLKGNCYRKKNSDIIYVEKNINNHDYILTKRILTDWFISDEKKNIQGYECIKATALLFVDDGSGEINKLYPVTAWFFPENKNPYGPMGYGGLPGLILELKNSIVTLRFNSIKTNKNSFPITYPKDIPIIPENKMYTIFSTPSKNDK